MTCSKVTILFLVSILAACHSKESKERLHESPVQAAQWPRSDSLPPLTNQQDSAFQALNTLQVSTDEKDHLYSTFGNIKQSCYPPDTVLTISQSELRTAMHAFVELHCTLMDQQERDRLAEAAVRSQDTYTLSLCIDRSAPNTFENGIPRSGTWVLTNVVGRRDVILVW